jgi:glutamine synthetase
MSKRLPESIFRSLVKTIKLGKPLGPDIAPYVAQAMLQWALSQGCTHYSHWFIPLTNATACKHEAFFSPTAIGEAALDFPTSVLVRGEPDASSFPSGGLRATFEARGYTGWDPTSPAFVRDGTLFIPSVFLSLGKEALDYKVPLLRSIEALNAAALRFLKFFPKVKAKRVVSYSGCEQEYFLVPRDLYEKRMDLRLCGRTLLGLAPPKTQQLEDHYMSHIRSKISAYMTELDKELWQLAIPGKTKHNEVAPAQHELAPNYETVNLASDHNQLMGEVMRNVAKRNGLACLLHEKPFEGVNGSGKHDNFSIGTDTGLNFFKPQDPSVDDSLFLLAVAALIRAADLHSDLLRMAAASPGNDQRLGGFEAPPPIISIFLGPTLLNQLSQSSAGSRESSTETLRITPSLPDLELDDSDRNRTSPFAFTGNKFEFRMLGSAQSVANMNTILNLIMAESFDAFADRLEHADDVAHEKKAIIRQVLKDHSRIIFNGNNYSKEWTQEAQKRGLPIITNSVDAYEALATPANVELFEKFNVLSREECHSRQEVLIEGYIKTIEIEAQTLIQTIQRDVLPAVATEVGARAAAVNALNASGVKNASLKTALEKLAGLHADIAAGLDALQAAFAAKNPEAELKEQAIHVRDKVLPAMGKVREPCDAAEALVPPENWPLPSYYSLFYRY